MLQSRDEVIAEEVLGLKGSAPPFTKDRQCLDGIHKEFKGMSPEQTQRKVKERVEMTLNSAEVYEICMIASY